MKFLYLACFWAFALPAFAQTKRIKERSMVTGKNITISIDGDHKDMARTPMKTQGIILYRRDAKGLSLGNLCAEQTMAMRGFQYEIVPERHDISRRRYFLHNMWSEVKLFFNNGFFWKARMQKEIDKCRELSGDYVED